uniref:Uncharacterized protein n=1 Tax=Dunaliella tertiolecta TaxID=3047 RepID=A0A7S3QRK5_DUNTE
MSMMQMVVGQSAGKPNRQPLCQLYVLMKGDGVPLLFPAATSHFSPSPFCISSFPMQGLKGWCAQPKQGTLQTLRINVANVTFCITNVAMQVLTGWYAQPKQRTLQTARMWDLPR